MIKGSFFGRSLKQLFIISLISCFILLGNSFVNSSYCGTYGSNFYNILTYTNTNTNFISDSDDSDFFSVSKNLNFLTDGHYNLLYHRYIGNIIGYGSVFWNNNKLYLYNSNNNGIDNSLGYVDNFVVCDAFTGGTSACDFASSCQFSSNSKITMSYSDFLADPNHGNADMIGLYFYYSDLNVFCLNYSNLGYSLCVNMSASIGNIVYDTAYWVGVQSSINDYPFMSHLGYSPFSSSSSSGVIIPVISGNLVESEPYTNGEIVKGFECVGLQPSLCYGGFPINNIFEPSEQFEDFSGYIAGEGATVFELYNLYSGSFTSLKQFLNTVLTRYRNGQINSFKTEPKALLMLGAQMNTAGINVDYISEYCTLLLKENSSDVYSGNTPGSLRARQCLRSEKIKDSFKNGSGLDVDFITTTGGIFGDSEDVDFDPATFFSSLMEEITTKLDRNLSGGSVGIIPGYIIIFTLAIIFIRLISH